jgi:hypothetical protein
MSEKREQELITVSKAIFEGLEELAAETATLRTERDTAVRGLVQLREASTDAFNSLTFIRTWSIWMQAHAPMDSDSVMSAFWSWAEGWDCDLESRLLAVLTATPTDSDPLVQLREVLARVDDTARRHLTHHYCHGLYSIRDIIRRAALSAINEPTAPPPEGARDGNQ